MLHKRQSVKTKSCIKNIFLKTPEFTHFIYSKFVKILISMYNLNKFPVNIFSLIVGYPGVIASFTYNRVISKSRDHSWVSDDYSLFAYILMKTPNKNCKRYWHGGLQMHKLSDMIKTYGILHMVPGVIPNPQVTEFFKSQKPLTFPPLNHTSICSCSFGNEAPYGI